MAMKFKEFSSDEVRQALMQSKRPTLLKSPEINSMTSCSNGKMRLFVMNSQETKRISGTGQDKGMRFVFSQTPFSISYSNGRKKDAVMKEINAVAIPGHAAYSIECSGVVYVGSISQEVAAECDISAPVGFTSSNIDRQLPKHGHNKLVVPKNINGEINATGGERLDMQEPKYLILGPINQEFSVGNSISPQDFHIHKILVESYTTFSGMTLHYAINGAMDTLKMEKGDTVIIPSGIFHYAQMHGKEPTFVMKAGEESIFDKFAIFKEKSIAEISQLISSLTA